MLTPYTSNFVTLALLIPNCNCRVDRQAHADAHDHRQNNDLTLSRCKFGGSEYSSKTKNKQISSVKSANNKNIAIEK